MVVNRAFRENYELKAGNPAVYSVSGVSVASATQTQLTSGAVLPRPALVPGSARLTIDGGTTLLAYDDVSTGNWTKISGSATVSSGALNRLTGAWSITLSAPIAAALVIGVAGKQYKLCLDLSFHRGGVMLSAQVENAYKQPVRGVTIDGAPADGTLLMWMYTLDANGVPALVVNSNVTVVPFGRADFSAQLTNKRFQVFASGLCEGTLILSADEAVVLQTDIGIRDNFETPIL